MPASHGCLRPAWSEGVQQGLDVARSGCPRPVPGRLGPAWTGAATPLNQLQGARTRQLADRREGGPIPTEDLWAAEGDEDAGAGKERAER